MRTINRSRLELYVESYLRMHPLRNIRNKDFIRKGLVYIEQFLDSTCCDEPDAIVDLVTNLDNEFTRTIYNILLGMSLRGNRKSIQRTINMIEDYLASCCSTSFTVPFSYDDSCPLSVFLTLNSFQIGIGCEYTPPDVPIDEEDVVECLNTSYTGIAKFSFDAGDITVTILNPVDGGIYELTIENDCP